MVAQTSKNVIVIQSCMEVIAKTVPENSAIKPIVEGLEDLITEEFSDKLCEVLANNELYKFTEAGYNILTCTMRDFAKDYYTKTEKIDILSGSTLLLIVSLVNLGVNRTVPDQMKRFTLTLTHITEEFLKDLYLASILLKEEHVSKTISFMIEELGKEIGED